VRFLYFILFLTCLAAPSFAEELTGEIVGVHDGDTVTVLTADKTQVKIRLAKIDAPELSQPYGMQSKKTLSQEVFGKNVKVIWDEKDKYGRTVGNIYADGIYVNAEMIKSGSAWVYRKYSNDNVLIAFEDQARNDKVGLWGLQTDQIVPPWEWRHGKSPDETIEETSETAANNVQSDIAFKCAGKTLCGQMTSCAEAKFYLTQCGLTRLDGDHDGVPCEKICR
jgi:endonuclease YncB( thermonuclease family)